MAIDSRRRALPQATGEDPTSSPLATALFGGGFALSICGFMLAAHGSKRRLAFAYQESREEGEVAADVGDAPAEHVRNQL